MQTKNNYIVPFEATHPGYVLREELQERGISAEDFADRIGVPFSLLDGFIKEKEGLTKEMALGFEKELGISYDFWYRMYASYIYDSAIIARRENEKKIEYKKPIPMAVY